MYLNISRNEQNSQKHFTLHIHDVHECIHILYRLHRLYINSDICKLYWWLAPRPVVTHESFVHCQLFCKGNWILLPAAICRMYGLGLCRLCWPQNEEIPKKYRNKYRRYSTCCGFVCVLLLFILLCIYFYCLFLLLHLHLSPSLCLSHSHSLSLFLAPEIVSIALQTIAQRTEADRNRQVTARRTTKCI